MAHTHPVVVKILKTLWSQHSLRHPEFHAFYRFQNHIFFPFLTDFCQEKYLFFLTFSPLQKVKISSERLRKSGETQQKKCRLQFYVASTTTYTRLHPSPLSRTLSTSEQFPNTGLEHLILASSFHNGSLSAAKTMCQHSRKTLTTAAVHVAVQFALTVC